MNPDFLPDVVSEPIRSSANGNPCTLQIQGVCLYRTDTVILAHYQTPGRGKMAGKCSDLSAGYACMACHDVWDRRDSRWDQHQQHFEFYARRSILRTQHLLLHSGILTVKGWKP